MIKNGKDTPINQISGTLPQMDSAMDGLFIPMTITQIVKSTINYRIVETKTNINFKGVWQLLSAKSIMLKPEHQRQWKWFRLHSATSLELENDGLVIYSGTTYRIKAVSDWSLYGYFEYHLVEDYQ